MSPASVEIVERLRKAGYEAYIVGGAIRDLLLGHVPTDFDVVTDATPERVKSLFKSARIIGRRFLIVHVRLYSDLVEVSTFRKNPAKKNIRTLSKAELYKRAENAYGTLEDDYQRRDFTLNALYYDLKSEAILDFVDGVRDVKARRLRCIGDPQQRFSEDPCRILRAVRFSSMLDLKLDPNTLKAIHQTKNLLNFVSPSRLEDQLVKLFLRGNGSVAFAQLGSLRILPILFGSRDVSNDLAKVAMENSDDRVAEGKSVTFSFIIAAMLWFRFRRSLTHPTDQTEQPHMRHAHAKKILVRQSNSIRLARFIREFITDTWLLQFDLEQEKPKNIRKIIDNERFRAAYDFLVLRARVGDCPQDIADWWTNFQQLDEEEQARVIRASKPARNRTRRRRRRRRTKNTVSNVATVS